MTLMYYYVLRIGSVYGKLISRKGLTYVDKYQFQSGYGYSDFNIYLEFHDFVIDIIYFLYEPRCHSFDSIPDNFFHLIYFKDGKTQILYHDQNLNVQPGSFLFFSPGQIHSEISNEENLTKFHICFNLISKKNKSSASSAYQKDSDYMFLTISQRDTLLLLKDPFPKTIRIFEEISSEYDANHFGYHLRLSGLFFDAFIAFARTFQLNSPALFINPISLSKSLPIYTISDIMNASYQDLTISKLAHQLDIGVRQLQRNIKLYYGTTFKKKLLEIRLQNAKMLLKTTQRSISEIAKEVGLENSSYFNRLFKEIEKTTPTDYRNTNSHGR